MTRIPVHTAPDGSRDTLQSLEAQFGKVLNIHGAMAHSPLVLDAYASLQHSIGELSTIDGKTREAIALAVAALDECTSCQAAHTAGGKAAGLTAALDAGWSDAQVAESTVFVALDVMTNFFNHTVQAELDLPAAPAL